MGIKMKKTYVLILSVFLIGIIVGVFSVKADTVTSSLGENKERIIVYQINADIDNDGLPEKIVLDEEKASYHESPGEYSRLLIYKISDKNEVLVFDSTKAGIRGFCGEHISKNELIRITDDNKDGTPEIYLSGFTSGSSPDEIVIIEYIAGKYTIMFDNEIANFGYKDFNNDGHLELYGIIQFGGQVRFNSPLWAAFIKKDDKYVPSYQYTQQLIKWRINEAIMSFKTKPDWSTADNIIGMYIFGGYIDELKSFMKENREILAKLKFFDEPFLTPDELSNFDTFFNSQKIMYDKKAVWLQSLQTENLRIAKANSASEEGFDYYKSHKDSRAIISYEIALNTYPTAETYYRYGNSLSNIPRLEDAIKAYQNAVKLNFDKPYLVYYNIACVYSRMKKSKEGFANLELAINNGYKNFDHIEKDDDLIWLRSQPEWKNWWIKHQFI